MKRVLIIELSSHAHVVKPWLLATEGRAQAIAITRVALPGISKSLDEQEIKQEIMIFDSFQFTLLLIKRLITSRVMWIFGSFKTGGEIILTSAPERRLSFANYFNMILLSFVGIDVLCIRNSGHWKLKNRNIKLLLRYSYNPLEIIRVVSSEIIDFWIEKFILNRSKKLVFESSEQRQLFNTGHFNSREKPQLVFCGRQNRESSTTPRMKSSNSIGVGLLGTINKVKRDYTEVSEAVKLLKNRGIVCDIFFLGAYIGPSSQEVLELFDGSLKFAPSAEVTYVSDKKIEEVIDEVDCFVSPMSGSHYQQGGSTGAVADSVFWQKPLLIPKKFKSNWKEGILYYYESAEDLAMYLSNNAEFLYLNTNHVETEVLNRFVFQKQIDVNDLMP